MQPKILVVTPRYDEYENIQMFGKWFSENREKVEAFNAFYSEVAAQYVHAFNGDFMPIIPPPLSKIQKRFQLVSNPKEMERWVDFANEVWIFEDFGVTPSMEEQIDIAVVLHKIIKFFKIETYITELINIANVREQCLSDGEFVMFHCLKMKNRVKRTDREEIKTIEDYWMQQKDDEEVVEAQQV